MFLCVFCVRIVVASSDSSCMSFVLASAVFVDSATLKLVEARTESWMWRHLLVSVSL